MDQWLKKVKNEAEKTNNLLLREFCQQLLGKRLYCRRSKLNFIYFPLDYLANGTTLHHGREKTVEFIRSCLETETIQIGILVSQGFESLIQEEELCCACTSQEKQDFLQYIFDAFPNGSPFVERELVSSIRLILNIVRTQCLVLSEHIICKLIQFTLGVLRTTNIDLRRETCQLCASKLEAFYNFRPVTTKEDRQYTDDGLIIFNSTELDYYKQALTLMEYQTSLIHELSRKPDQTLQRIFILELHDLLVRSLTRTVYFYQPFIDFIWKKYSPAVVSFLGSPIIDARCIMYVKNNASDPHLRRIVYRIILNLICFIAPIGSLRSVSETLFQRLCLSQTTNERSDLLIVLNEVITSQSLISLISPPWIHSVETTNDSDLSLFRKIISIIAECSSSDDRILVNNAYLCLNHCLEQLKKFCDEALFFDNDEEQAIRRLYKKFSYPIVPLFISTDYLLNLLKNDKLNIDEVYLTFESSTLDKVNFYAYHLKILLKTSDEQHITSVCDFDDALLQFSSFISNEYSSKISLSSETSPTVVTNPDGVYATTIWFLWYCCRRQLQQLFDSNMPSTISKNSFVADIMNSGFMLCIEPDWMDTLYDIYFEKFNIFEDLSDQFKTVLHQMLIDIRSFDMRSVKAASGDLTSRHDAKSIALSICHRLVQMCWSALLGALTPMLTKNHSMDSDLTSSNSILSNTISEKYIEAHELVFQGLKLVFQLAVTVGLPDNACYVLHCVVSTIEQGWLMDNQRKIFSKHHRLHYLDVMAINFILQLYMNDLNDCPTIIYKYVLRCCVHLCLLEMQCCPPKEKLDLTVHQHGHVSYELNNANSSSSSNDSSTASLLQLSNIDKTGHIHDKSCANILQALSCRSDKLFELVARNLDLDSLLEFFEQIRLLTETPMSKRTSDISPLPPQNLFPMHVVIERVGDMTLGIIASLRPRYHVCKVWSCVSQLFIQGATHRDIQLAKRTISHMHRDLRSWLSVRPEYPNFQLNEAFFKPFEHLICTEQCDSIVENQIVNSICELVELNTNAIMSGWRSIFTCLKAVKIEQHRRSIEMNTTTSKDKQYDENETEQAGVELYRVNAILEVLEAFFSCENLNVISQASVDCLQCLFCYLREPEPFTPMVNSPFGDSFDENDEEHNQIELVLPALNMIQKFTTIFIHCYVTSSNYVFATKKRTRQFESTSFTNSTFSNFSSTFFSYLDMSTSTETILRSFELKLVGYMRQLSDDLDLVDNTTHLLNVWSYMIEGLTDTIFSCSNHYHIKIIDQYFVILKLTFDSVGHRFSIYLICCVIIPWLQSFVCSNFLKVTSSLRKLTIFRRHAQRQTSTFMNITAWRLFLGNLLEHILYIFEAAKEFEEYHHILFDCFQSMLIDWLCVANEYVGRLGLSCIKHLISNISKKFDQSLKSICIDNIQHALLLTSLPTEYLMYEFLVSSPEDLLHNVRVYVQNDSNASILSSYGLANGDISIFPLCQQLFNEHHQPQPQPQPQQQQQQQKVIEGKFFRFTFRTKTAIINDPNPHEIQMKNFVFLNYFHLQLIHIVGELNWSELIPCLIQTIDLAERFDSAVSNFGLRNILQQLFTFDPPAVSFQHIKRIAFQYLVDHLMPGVKNELVKQSIQSANSNLQQENDEQIDNNLDEYVSFPETLSPSQEINGDIVKQKGFFSQFTSYIITNPHNYIGLLKMLSDGIADILFTGLNRFETCTEMNQIGLYLLRADQDLIDRFIATTAQSTLKQCPVSENEIEYFIVNQDMICRVLNDHKILRKIDLANSTSPDRRKSSSTPLQSPSLPNYHPFLSQSLFNDTTKSPTDDQRTFQETLSMRNTEHISIALKLYVDGWNDLCLYLATALQENGCLCSPIGASSNLLISSLERWLFVCATNATNRQLKNLLLDILMKYGGKEAIITRT
ncbi:unnamed protein product [Rotaria socialis]|uniref:Mon2/Sec7/BIG1-like HDS domain-containing protein n=1 Tax=Rotaria socialis TaxID=392032 RepID=A0A817VNA7_9BILA|nr:unnamed protein product [Rotaria socialis]CAF4340617.1 unnamed protein product [Rotaria socialis]